MKSRQVQLDQQTYRALGRVAPGAERVKVVKAAIRDAIREAEEQRTRRAYQEQPDSEAAADDWANAEPWKP